MANIGNGAVEGQVNYNTVSVTAAYTVLVTDELVLANATGGNFTVSLPAPTAAGVFSSSNPAAGVTGQGNAGQRVTVLNVGASGTVTVDGVLPQYIRAGGKVALANNDSSATFQSDGTFWNCVAKVS